jgi:predicted methyltransferase
MTKLIYPCLCVVALGCTGASRPAQGSETTVPTTMATESPTAADTPARGDAPAPMPPVATETTTAFDAALAGAHRSEANKARDQYRHPRQTLAFFGVTPTQHVIELWPGGGWYTEVLAPALREHGQLSVVAPTGKYLPPYREMLAAHPELYDRVQVVEVTPPASLTLGPDASADVVLTFRNVHNWITGGFAEPLQAAVFRVLKPGGVYGVVEHRAAPGTTLEQTKKSGYVTEDAVIKLVTDAGFVLEGRSEINANPRDTKDYSEGVWTLPPSLRLGEVDKGKYLAIGESDRMTLRFRKPMK